MHTEKNQSMPTTLLVENLSLGLYENYSNQPKNEIEEINSTTITEALDLAIKHYEISEQYEVCAKILNFKNNIAYV